MDISRIVITSKQFLFRNRFLLIISAFIAAPISIIASVAFYTLAGEAYSFKNLLITTSITFTFLIWIVWFFLKTILSQAAINNIKENLKGVFHHKPSPFFLQFLLHLSLSFLFGSAWFLLLYGRFPLYFSHVDWIYILGNDTFGHQIGWEWFRQEPWRFPLGRIEAYGYPFGTYVSYLDSIPLLAIPFKLLSPWLGDHFQYMGIWELASIIGQMLVSMLILNEFTRSYSKKILGASLLVLSPPLIYRAFVHNSLTAHWLLLAAIWFILLEYRHKLWPGSWIVLFAVAMLVIPYIAAMLLPLWAIGLFFHYTREKKRWVLIAQILAVISVILLIGYSTGLFSLSSTKIAGYGFGFYSWNLNGFINPNWYSSFLEEMPVGTKGQYEGFSYLGLGNLLILPIALFLFLQEDCLRRRLFFFLPFGFVAILLSLFALSQKAFLGAHPLWNIQLSNFIFAMFSIFRSSGRFIWPVFYFLVLFGLISILRNSRYPTLLLFLALLLQYIDIQKLYESKKFNGFAQYQSDMQAEFWQQAAKTNRHIFLIPASWGARPYYEPIALYARQNRLTLNWGYFSRGEYDSIENYGKQVWEDLKAGRVDTQTMYILWDSDWIGLTQEYLSDHMLICQVDGYNVILSEDNELTLTNFNLSDYCLAPVPKID